MLGLLYVVTEGRGQGRGVFITVPEYPGLHRVGKQTQSSGNRSSGLQWVFGYSLLCWALLLLQSAFRRYGKGKGYS